MNIVVRRIELFFDHLEVIGRFRFVLHNFNFDFSIV